MSPDDLFKLILIVLIAIVICGAVWALGCWLGDVILAIEKAYESNESSHDFEDLPLDHNHKPKSEEDTQ